MSPGFRHASHAFSVRDRKREREKEGGMDGWRDGGIVRGERERRGEGGGTGGSKHL